MHPSAPTPRPRPSGPRRSGVTLLELVVVLGVLGVALGVALPVTGAVLDRWAVAAARDEALALLHRSRMEARLHGGARLVLTSDPATAELRVGDSVVTRWSAPAGGVVLGLPRDRPSDLLRFDALGLGVVTSRTLRFHRGNAESRLIISSRGRARRD